MVFHFRFVAAEMAEATRDCSIPFGYDEEFVNPVVEDFNCPICQLPLKEPVLTRCGHRFCKECLEECMRRQEQEGEHFSCPVDRKALVKEKDYFPDLATERNVLSLAIKCQSEGCEWSGELRAKESHLTSCIYKTVSCTNGNCEVKVAKKDLEEHMTMACDWRTVECEYCHEHHPQCHMEEHYEKCKRYPMICPGGCMKLTSREMLENHTENYCPKTAIPCPYAQMGCKAKVQREKLASHIQSDLGPHINLVCLGLTETREELTKTTREQISLKEEFNGFQDDYEQKVNTFCSKEEVNLLKRQVEDDNEQRMKNSQEDLKGYFEEKFNVLQGEQAASKVEFDAFQNKLKGSFKIVQDDVNHLRRQLQEKADQEAMTVFQNDQQERVKHLEGEVNVLKHEHVAHQVKLDDFQDRRAKNLQDDLNHLRQQLEENVQGHEAVNEFQNEQKVRINNLEKQIEEMKKQGRRDKLVYALVCVVFGLLIFLK